MRADRYEPMLIIPVAIYVLLLLLSQIWHFFGWKVFPSNVSQTDEILMSLGCNSSSGVSTALELGPHPLNCT
jgi:hypothetical protein